ncbi:hypothetical protein [Streptomyces noursei]|uniref:hypothetical protein n=1 Tax=Streptomyces noursei TaxID=1971 RepID=UPI0013520F3B
MTNDQQAQKKQLLRTHTEANTRRHLRANGITLTSHPAAGRSPLTIRKEKRSRSLSIDSDQHQRPLKERARET